MPFPSNWLEELVAEWLSLKGYLVETNLRLQAGQTGGAYEADVIGVKLGEDSLEIKHVECMTQLVEKPSEEPLQRILRKFSEECIDSVKKFIMSRFRKSLERREYDKLLVVGYVSNEEGWKRSLENNEIRLVTFRELMQEIVRTIDEWKKERKSAGLIKGETLRFPWITLPTSYWMLNLVDVLKSLRINPCELE